MTSPRSRRARKAHASVRMSAASFGAALLDVGQVSLVRLDLRRWRWIPGVEIGWEAAARAVPGVGNRGICCKCGPRLMTVCAEVRDVMPRGGVAPLGLAHRTSPHPTATNGASTSHVRSPSPFLAVDELLFLSSS